MLEWLEGVGRSKLVRAEKSPNCQAWKNFSDWPVTPFVHPGHRPVPGRGYGSGHLGDQLQWPIGNKTARLSWIGGILNSIPTGISTDISTILAFKTPQTSQDSWATIQKETLILHRFIFQASAPILSKRWTSLTWPKWLFAYTPKIRVMQRSGSRNEMMEKRHIMIHVQSQKWRIPPIWLWCKTSKYHPLQSKKTTGTSAILRGSVDAILDNPLGIWSWKCHKSTLPPRNMEVENDSFGD